MRKKTQKGSMFQRTIILAYLIFLPFYVWAISDLDNAFPQPALKPNEVVRLQLLAMQKNDVSDHGIEITFRFASPSNKTQTGPLKRFIRLLKNLSYQHLLNHHSVNFLDLTIKENIAIHDVIITTTTGRRIGYRFRLSLQKSTKYLDCWMTDAVMPFEILEV